MAWLLCLVCARRWALTERRRKRRDLRAVAHAAAWIGSVVVFAACGESELVPIVGGDAGGGGGAGVAAGGNSGLVGGAAGAGGGAGLGMGGGAGGGGDGASGGSGGTGGVAGAGASAGSGPMDGGAGTGASGAAGGGSGTGGGAGTGGGIGGAAGNPTHSVSVIGGGFFSLRGQAGEIIRGNESETWTELVSSTVTCQIRFATAGGQSAPGCPNCDFGFRYSLTGGQQTGGNCGAVGYGANPDSVRSPITYGYLQTQVLPFRQGELWALLGGGWAVVGTMSFGGDPDVSADHNFTATFQR